MFYDIVQVIPYKDYTVYVYFEDGKIVCYDAKPLLNKKVFEPLKDINFFINACTILNGTLAWDVTGTSDCSKCLDIDPEMLYGLENVSEKIAQGVIIQMKKCVCCLRKLQLQKDCSSGNQSNNFKLNKIAAPQPWKAIAQRFCLLRIWRCDKKVLSCLDEADKLH